MSKLPPVFWARWSFFGTPLQICLHSRRSRPAGWLVGALMLHLILQSALSSNLFQIFTLVMLLVPFLLITVTSVEIDSMKKISARKATYLPHTRDQGCSGTGGGWLPTHPTAGGHQNLWRAFLHCAFLQLWASKPVEEAYCSVAILGARASCTCNLLFSPQTRAR